MQRMWNFLAPMEHVEGQHLGMLNKVRIKGVQGPLTDSVFDDFCERLFAEIIFNVFGLSLKLVLK